jgi:hypothetical protein
MARDIAADTPSSGSGSEGKPDTRYPTIKELPNEVLDLIFNFRPQLSSSTFVLNGPRTNPQVHNRIAILPFTYNRKTRPAATRALFSNVDLTPGLHPFQPSPRFHGERDICRVFLFRRGLYTRNYATHKRWITSLILPLTNPY